MNNWQLDKTFLENTIAKGQNLLKSTALSSSQKKEIKNDIKVFENFLAGNFNCADIENIIKPTLPHDKTKLKEYILAKMRKQYEYLGPDLIKWLINLKESSIFYIDETPKIYPVTLAIEEQAELTIKNYEVHSKKHLEKAKKIIYNDKPKQIQLVEKTIDSSWCYYDSINKLPFIIIGADDDPSALNHEVEHGIEDVLGYKYHNLYLELGPQYFELLFDDKLYNNEGIINIGEYQEKIDEIVDYLQNLHGYFKIMSIFAQSNFNVSTKTFEETFLKNTYLEPEELDTFLRTDIASDAITDDMTYLFSFLKAIELREQTYSTTKTSDELLGPYLTRGKFTFEHQKDTYKVYERFVGEVNQKIKAK